PTRSPTWCARCARSRSTSRRASRTALEGRTMPRSSSSSTARSRRSRAAGPAAPVPDAGGHFGQYGGRYAPETLMPALLDLEKAYFRLRRDPAFRRELTGLLREYAGRPTLFYFARRLSQRLGGARIYLKREDLLYTGAHKINNALGQALLARRLWKSWLIAETGAGQHGVAVATVAAVFGL